MTDASTNYVYREKYKALEAEYRLGMCDLAKQKEQCLLGLGFSHEYLLEADDNLTSFYTYRYISFKDCSGSIDCKTEIFSAFSSLSHGIMLNVTNYDLGFQFCIHETTVSRILTK